MKVFNTTAVCIPSENYMVDISDLQLTGPGSMERQPQSWRWKIEWGKSMILSELTFRT